MSMQLLLLAVFQQVFLLVLTRIIFVKIQSRLINALTTASFGSPKVASFILYHIFRTHFAIEHNR